MAGSLVEAIRLIRHDATSLLTYECALSFRAFLGGLQVSDVHVAAIRRSLLEHIDGPDQMDACGRAYLAFRNTREALGFIFHNIESFAHRSESAPTEARHEITTVSFVDSVRDAIMDGHAGTVLGEPTISYLADYASGYNFGLRFVDASAAQSRVQELDAFEAWLQGYYGGVHACWYGLIRVFEGNCESGLRRFVLLWDAFKSGTDPGATYIGA